MATFLPLLLLECWNEIKNVRDEILQGTSEMEAVTGRLAGRATVDDFTEVYLSIDRMSDRQVFAESDIIFMRGPCETLGKVHQILGPSAETSHLTHLGPYSNYSRESSGGSDTL